MRAQMPWLLVFFFALGVSAQARNAIEVGLRPGKPHGYFWGAEEKPTGELVLLLKGNQPLTVEAAARLLDHRGEKVATLLSRRLDLQPGKPLSIPLELDVERFGVFFIEARVGGTTARTSLCWLPEPAPTWPDSPFGVCCHFGQRKHSIPLTFELLKKMGASWFRDEISWGASEPRKGVFEFRPYHDLYMRTAAKMGLRLFIIFDYGNRLYDAGNAPTSPEGVEAFTRYCLALMKRYRGVCRHWEVWNEPNIFFWKPRPNVADYTRLLKAVYAACKSADPEATVVGVCTAGTDLRFVEGVLKLGGGKFMDAISVHPYRYPRSPEESDFVGEMKRLKALLDKHGCGHLKVWLTEFGYPTHTGKRGLPEHRAAAYLVRQMLHALSLPFVERLFVYDFQNDGTRPDYNEHNFGLIRLDHTPKVAYAAYNTMVRMLARKTFSRAVAAGEGVVCYEFAGPQGKVIAAWATKTPATLSIETPSNSVTATDLMSNSRALKPSNGRLQLAAGEEPVFITDY